MIYQFLFNDQNPKSKDCHIYGYDKINSYLEESTSFCLFSIENRFYIKKRGKTIAVSYFYITPTVYQ